MLTGHPDKLGRVQTTKIKKRISIIDDLTHTSDDDSDTEINLSANGMSSTACDDSVLTINESRRPETTSKSESLLSTPTDGWDISSDGVRASSEGLESSINESNKLFL